MSIASVAVLGASVILAGCSSSTTIDEIPPGDPLPALEVGPLVGDGDALSLADLRGQTVLVSFWGPWCPPCLEELPEVARLEKKYRDDEGIRVLPIAYMSDGTSDPSGPLPKQVEDVLRSKGLDMHIYFDVDSKTIGAFASVEDFMGYPTNFVIDPEGKIRFARAGGLLKSQFDEVESLMLTLAGRR